MLILSACTPKEEPEVLDVLEVRGIGELVTFDAVGAESVTFTIYSETEWTMAQKDTKWLEISSLKGKPGSTDITIKASDNEGIAVRNGVIRVVAGNNVRNIEVVQLSSEPSLVLLGIEDNRIEFDSIDINPFAIKIVSNVEWKCTSSGLDWCTLSASEGEEGVSDVILTPSMNRGDQREGTLTFSSDYTKDITVRVVQDEVKAYIFVDRESVEFKHVESSFDIKVSSNVDWKATCSDTWITLSEYEGTGDDIPVSIKVSMNEGKDRIATISFVARNETKTVTVSQAAFRQCWDLREYPLLWRCDDAVHVETISPDWSDNGVNATSFGTGKGILMPDETTLAWGQWIVIGSGTGEYKASHITSKEGHYAVKQVFTNDQLVFTIPVVSVRKGDLITLSLGMKPLSTMAKYWVAEFQEGNNGWSPMETGHVYESKGLNAFSNIALSTTASATKITATFSPLEDIEYDVIQLRIRCADGTYSVANGNLSKPATGATIRFTGTEGDDAAFPTGGIRIFITKNND